MTAVSRSNLGTFVSLEEFSAGGTSVWIFLLSSTAHPYMHPISVALLLKHTPLVPLHLISNHYIIINLISSVSSQKVPGNIGGNGTMVAFITTFCSWIHETGVESSYKLAKQTTSKAHSRIQSSKWILIESTALLLFFFFCIFYNCLCLNTVRETPWPSFAANL